MGQEIVKSHFAPEEFAAFAGHLAAETELLIRWLQEGRFSSQEMVGGYELEAWLVDHANRPAPVNAEFLERLHDPLVVPELARFNVELNGHPRGLHGDALSELERGLAVTWAGCNRQAAALDARLLMIGILPTLQESELSPANMSDMKRYRALNEQVLRLRDGKPLVLDIQGRDHLCTRSESVMLEAATTSFQIHLKVGPEHAVRACNSAMVISAPMVGISSNSPYLFGRDLWDETRIPLFEQSVAVGGYAGAAYGPMRRVTFGSGYMRESISECFVENLEHYPVLLPMQFDEDREQLAHLRLHNGTIWRWNRPLVGFDADGTPHLRIEHRVVPGGPTVVDNIANAALFFGLMKHLVDSRKAPEQQLDFVTARDNFLSAARHGLEGHVRWFDGARGTVQSLVLEHLLPMARHGLELLEIREADIERYLGIIRDRARTNRTGAAWQRAYVARHGPDMAALTEAYRQLQQGGAPVHEWEIG
jgi:hypothetical protein